MTSSASADASLYDGNRRLREELVRRWRAPRRDPTYLLFFVTSLILLSGAGFWLELLKLSFGLGPVQDSLPALRSAIGTYVLAILGGTAMQLAISETLRSLRALGQLLGWVLGSIALVIVFAANLADLGAIALGLVGSVLTLAFWWIVNADVREFRDDQPPPEVATGGEDVTVPLLGAGALANFEK